MREIYFNGLVYTGEDELSRAFVVEEGSFIFTGSDADAKAMAQEGDTMVDLEGKFVCPGFNDSHMHLLNYGQALNCALLGEHTQSLQDMLKCLSDFLEEHPVSGDGWLVGRGWNHDYFTDHEGMPTRYDLDKVSTEVPIMIVRCCGHCLAVNSKIIELLGITAETQAPEGGEIGLEKGVPNGLFFDNAMQMVHSAMPVPDKEGLKDYIRLACKAINSYGVTSSHTDDYCVFRQIPWQTVNEAYKELEEAGELTVRVYEQSNFTTVEDLKEFIEAGCRTGAGSDMFKIGPLKMLGDGALGARTAFLSRPYADDPSTCGLSVYTKEVMDNLIMYANKEGMQIAVHTIGDKCLDWVLDAMEKALAAHPREDHRHGIVHCQITRAEQLDKMAEMKLHVYAQSIFLDYDNHIVEERVGKELASTSYSWKTLMNKGVSVSNGTDCPVELPNAMAGMQCAVTRTTLRDNVGPYLPQEAFTVKEALDSYTIRSAEGSFEENVKGRIAPGYKADFVILGGNPFEVDVNSIKDIPVLATFLAGNMVFEA